MTGVRNFRNGFRAPETTRNWVQGCSLVILITSEVRNHPEPGELSSFRVERKAEGRVPDFQRRVYEGKHIRKNWVGCNRKKHQRRPKHRLERTIINFNAFRKLITASHSKRNQVARSAEIPVPKPSSMPPHMNQTNWSFENLQNTINFTVQKRDFRRCLIPCD